MMTFHIRLDLDSFLLVCSFSCLLAVTEVCNRQIDEHTIYFSEWTSIFNFLSYVLVTKVKILFFESRSIDPQ